jgi:hypothetical protein
MFLCTLIVAGCSPSPRYTLHEASEPSTGARVTLRIDTTTGEALSLGSLPTTPGGRVLFWAPVLDQVTALAAIRTLDEAKKPASPSQP